MKAFFGHEMKENLTKKMTPVFLKTKSLEELKQKILASTSLLPGAFTRADELAKCTQVEIQHYFDSNKTPPIRKVIKWTNYASNDVDSIESELLSKQTGSIQSIESNLNNISIISEASQTMKSKLKKSYVENDTAL